MLGNSLGGLSVYDYMTRTLVKTVTSPANSEGIQNNNVSQVTCIKYSHNGTYLILCVRNYSMAYERKITIRLMLSIIIILGLVLSYGCANGSFWFVDPRHLTPLYVKPFRWNGSPIRLIRFSASSRYVVHTVSFTVATV